MKADDGRAKANCYKSDVVCTSGALTNKRQVSVEVELPRGGFMLVPTTFNPNESGLFFMTVFSESPVTLKGGVEMGHSEMAGTAAEPPPAALDGVEESDEDDDDPYFDSVFAAVRGQNDDYVPDSNSFVAPPAPLPEIDDDVVEVIGGGTPCNKCGGSGCDAKKPKKQCKKCKGDGFLDATGKPKKGSTIKRKKSKKEKKPKTPKAPKNDKKEKKDKHVDKKSSHADKKDKKSKKR